MLLQYMETLTTKVEKIVALVLLDIFAIVFDGWFTSDTHSITVMETYPDIKLIGYASILLSISPLQ